MSPFEAAFKVASPRLTSTPTPRRSLLIHGAVLVIWMLALAASLYFHGLLAWSTGLVYVGYDTALLLFVCWHSLSIPARQGPVSVATGHPRLGIVVAAYNEAAALPATLAALFGQTDAPERIVIADDGSDDATAELLVERYGLAAPSVGTTSVGNRHPSLIWLRLPHRGKAAALNAAFAALDTEIVVTVDADTILAPEAIAAMRRAFAAAPDLVAATGVIAPHCAPTLGGRLLQWFQTYEYMRNFLSRFAWMRLGCLLLISGAFAGFRRDAVIAVGGFDPDCLVEDYELIHRLRRVAARDELDWRTGVLGEACARTDAPATLASFLRQRRRWFGGFLQTQYWYRDMVGDPRYGTLGLVMLPVKAIDTLQPLYGLVAFALLLRYLLRGDFAVLVPVAGVMGAKIFLDLAFHLWTVQRYRRWIGAEAEARYWAAFLVAVAEPFTFQILRHLGAALGWIAFLTRQRRWTR
jgi:cellulose synthase/poly-beta-1,6-N-acetylglucosamine synthase-like glycosyltransferase